MKNIIGKAVVKNIVGKKVKLEPHCVYYWSECPDNNVMIVGSVSVSTDTVVVNVIDGGGNILPCYLNEIKYLNNKPVKLE